MPEREDDKEIVRVNIEVPKSRWRKIGMLAAVRGASKRETVIQSLTKTLQEAEDELKYIASEDEQRPIF